MTRGRGKNAEQQQQQLDDAMIIDPPPQTKKSDEKAAAQAMLEDFAKRMFGDAMKDPTLVPQTEEEEVKPRVVSFAQCWLEPPDFPADFEPTWSVFVNFQSSP